MSAASFNTSWLAAGPIKQAHKLAIFNALFIEHLRLTETIEADFLAKDINFPLDRGISDYIDAYAIYFEQPIPRCIVSRKMVVNKASNVISVENVGGNSSIDTPLEDILKKLDKDVSISTCKESAFAKSNVKRG